MCYPWLVAKIPISLKTPDGRYVTDSMNWQDDLLSFHECLKSGDARRHLNSPVFGNDFHGAEFSAITQSHSESRTKEV